MKAAGQCRDLRSILLGPDASQLFGVWFVFVFLFLFAWFCLWFNGSIRQKFTWLGSLGSSMGTQNLKLGLPSYYAAAPFPHGHRYFWCRPECLFCFGWVFDTLYHTQFS